MGIDECGDDFRAYGSECLEREYTFPAFDEDDDAMWEAYQVWKLTIEAKVNEEWQSIYGPERRLFLEETYASQFSRIPFRGIFG